MEQFISENERWRHIKGFENRFIVSDYGKIKSLLSGKIMKTHIDKGSGYEKISFSVGGKKITRYVHRLVIEAFSPPINKNNKLVCNHINGVKTDNHIKNLEWCTQSENIIHSYKIGLQPCRKGNSNGTKTKVSHIRHICRLLENFKQSVVIKKTGRGSSMIRKIYRGETWIHISKNYKFKDTNYGKISR